MSGLTSTETKGREEDAMSDMRPLPRPLRWVAIGFNVLQLLVTAILLFQRGLRIEEAPMVTFFVVTPAVNLAMFLDYDRRGL
jgi:hypothetical protein